MASFKVIVCYNTVNKYNNDVATTLIQNMLKQYDYCRAKYNSHDLFHLACTEVCELFIFLIFFFVFCCWNAWKIILCHNRVYKQRDVTEILSHELVHSFDYCRAHIDINNNSHVACTEVKLEWLIHAVYFCLVKNNFLFSSSLGESRKFDRMLLHGGVQIWQFDGKSVRYEKGKFSTIFFIHSN